MAKVQEPRPQGGIPWPSPSLFDELDDAAREAVAPELDVFSVNGGRVLFERGEASDALYVVLTGVLGVVTHDECGTPSLHGHVCAGETVGEMGVLSGRPRSATVIALRDSRLLRIRRETFVDLVARHPRAMMRVTAQLVGRLEAATNARPKTLAPGSLAIMPLGEAGEAVRLAQALAGALAAMGLRTATLDASAARWSVDAFARVEAAQDLTIYVGAPSVPDAAEGCDVASPLWNQFCLREADRILYVGSGAPPTPVLAPVAEASVMPWRMTDLVLLQPDDAARPVAAAAPWLDRLAVDTHHHVRLGHRADIDRLARRVVGRGVGLVLSGGGARGCAHVGVIRAMRELGVPIDLVGGTSFGAIVAAGMAHDWSNAEMRERLHQIFGRRDPIRDFAVPLVALTRGREVRRHFELHFGDEQVEDQWLPCFAVAANLTRNTLAVLSRGGLGDAVRASIAIPGLLPPIIADGEVLVDGGVMNNLPTDVMRAFTPGPIIAVDISPPNRGAGRASATGTPARRRWLRRLFSQREYDDVSILGLLLRAATVSSEAQAKLCREASDVLLVPPLGDIGLLDWTAIDRAIETGYRYAMEQAETLVAVAAEPPMPAVRVPMAEPRVRASASA